jgi:ferritin-like metal-binding protein YciE
MKVRHTIDSEYAKVTERVKTHVTETRQQVDRVSQEVKTKTMTLLSDITEHRNQTEAEINDIRQELSRAKQQLTNEWVAGINQVTDNLADCRRQVDAVKQGNVSEFQKVRAEISDLKCKLAEKQAVNDQSAIRSSINLSQAGGPSKCRSNPSNCHMCTT